MLVLALDTASPTTSVAVAESAATDFTVLASIDVLDAKRPAEQLAPAIHHAMTEAGTAMADIGLVAVGVGPGPFTGLRAGLVTARVLGDVLAVPVVGVMSLDALAVAAAEHLPADIGDEFVVATDARRHEVYWARYRHGARVEGPSVGAPAAVDLDGRRVVGRGATLYPDLLGEPASDILDPPAWTLALLAIDALLRGDPLPPDPMYLRRPDVAEPHARKRVSV